MSVKNTKNINAYLTAGENIELKKRAQPLAALTPMDRGNSAVDGGGLLLDSAEVQAISSESKGAANKYVKKFIGSEELINGKQRYCLWIEDQDADEAINIESIAKRLEVVKEMRLSSSKAQTVALANTPHKFGEIRHHECSHVIVVPRVSSENREFLPVDYIKGNTIIGDRNFGMYDAPIWNMSLICSRLHWVWIGTVCVRMRTDFSYSNTLGWNTFPVPKLTEKNKEDLTKCAEEILLAREAHFPATIADLYSPEKMPEDLRRAHEKNDEVLERIYIGRRFRNDTERLEKLFDMYTKMTNSTSKKKVS